MVAAWQSYRMLHFDESGLRTTAPEKLSGLSRARVLITGVCIPRPRAVHTPDDFGLPFESRWISETGGVRLAVWHIPQTNASGVALLFPGYGAERSSLLEQACQFHELGYAVALVDFQGAGGSSGKGTTLGFREATDVALAADWARRNLDPAVLILYGQSMGAAAVLRAVASRGVQADGVVVESVFDTLAQTVRNRFTAMRLPATPLAELLVVWGGWWSGYPAFSLRPVDDMAHVRCPVLMLHGEEDPRVLLNEARHVYDAAVGAKRLVVFAGAAHESLVAHDQALWRDAVGEFCAEVARAKQ